MAKPALIIRIGNALWGEHWTAPMAEVLDVDPRTTRRYGSGDREPGENVLHELRPSLIKRRQLLDELIAEIPEKGES